MLDGGDFLPYLQQSLSPPRYPSSIQRSHYRCFLPDLTGFAGSRRLVRFLPKETPSSADQEGRGFMVGTVRSCRVPSSPIELRPLHKDRSGNRSGLRSRPSLYKRLSLPYKGWVIRPEGILVPSVCTFPSCIGEFLTFLRKLSLQEIPLFIHRV